LDSGTDMPGNFIVMGKGGVGKSFLIRAMEYGIWQLLKDKYGQEEYPTVCTAVKLAACTGKAAFQVGGITIHSLLGIGKIDGGNILPLDVKSLRRLQRYLKNACFLFHDE